MKTALMIIDMQKEYYKGKAKESMDSACEYINAALEAFRQNGLPVFWVQDKDAEGGVIPGTEGFEIIEALRPAKDECRITKEYGNAFNKTDCLDMLIKAGADTVVITGYCAEFCVLSTYRGALDLDLTPILLRNAIASGSAANIQFVEGISNVITYPVLKKIISDNGK